MSIINLERDMSWIEDRSLLSAGAAVGYSTTAWAVATNASVSQRVNNFACSFSTTASGGNFINVGALILPPTEGDNLPYRLHGSAAVSDASNFSSWWLGFYNGGTVARAVQIAVGPNVDKVVVFPPILAADPDFGKSLCFFCSTRAITVASAACTGYVQRMISKPPQFASAVS